MRWVCRSLVLRVAVSVLVVALVVVLVAVVVLKVDSTASIVNVGDDIGSGICWGTGSGSGGGVVFDGVGERQYLHIRRCRGFLAAAIVVLPHASSVSAVDMWMFSLLLPLLLPCVLLVLLLLPFVVVVVLLLLLLFLLCCCWRSGHRIQEGAGSR